MPVYDSVSYFSIYSLLTLNVVPQIVSGVISKTQERDIYPHTKKKKSMLARKIIWVVIAVTI